MTVAVGLGLMQLPFSGARDYWRWVDLCEAGGVDSLWQTDRIIGREPILECMTTMAALAGRTRRLKFGMNVVSLALRDPVLVAKQCATIDVLSEGRLLPGFGIGSPLAPEWEALAIDTRTRGAKTDEGLEIIGRLWREERVDFAGKHFTLKGAGIAPRPVQADIPMWIGGSSEAAIRRTARFGTGWQGGQETPAETREVIAAIRSSLAVTGRSIDDDHYGAGPPFWFGRTEDEPAARVLATYAKRNKGRDGRAYVAIGDAGAIIERIAEYVQAGVSKFVLRPLGRDGDEVISQTRRLVEEVLPEVARCWPKPAKQPSARAAQ
jgi:probable F420-dependent oxidoreductase